MTTIVNNLTHEVHQIGTTIRTHDGKHVDLLNPTPEMIHLSDIIYGLSSIGRWNGQTEDFFSVAKHSLLVCLLVPVPLKPAALLHDASEAYLGNVTKPLKNILGDTYKNLETKFQKVIAKRFSIPMEQFEAVKPYDLLAQEIEWEAFFLHNSERLFETFALRFDKYDRALFADFASLLGIQ